jgi:hypothetical protein
MVKTLAISIPENLIKSSGRTLAQTMLAAEGGGRQSR